MTEQVQDEIKKLNPLVDKMNFSGKDERVIIEQHYESRLRQLKA